MILSCEEKCCSLNKRNESNSRYSKAYLSGEEAHRSRRKGEGRKKETSTPTGCIKTKSTRFDSAEQESQFTRFHFPRGEGGRHGDHAHRLCPDERDIIERLEMIFKPPRSATL